MPQQAWGPSQVQAPCPTNPYRYCSRQTGSLGDTTAMRNANQTGLRHQSRDPLPDDVADDRDAESDDEHVEAGAKHAATREDGSRGADDPMRGHRDDEGQHDGRRAGPYEKWKDGN